MRIKVYQFSDPSLIVPDRVIEDFCKRKTVLCADQGKVRAGVDAAFSAEEKYRIYSSVDLEDALLMLTNLEYRADSKTIYADVKSLIRVNDLSGDSIIESVVNGSRKFKMRYLLTTMDTTRTVTSIFTFDVEPTNTQKEITMTSKMKICTLLCLDNQEFVTQEIKQQLADLFDNSLFKNCPATCDIIPDVGVVLTGRAYTLQLNNRGKAYLPQFIELVDKMDAVVLSAT